MNNHKNMLSFMVVSALLQLAANLTHPVTPTIFTDLNLGSYMFGYALAAMMLMNFLFSPFWGKINGYISSKMSLLICCIGYGIGQMLFALSVEEWQFILVRMFSGVFTGGVFVSLLTYIINTSRDDIERGYNLTVSATIQSVFSAFGYLVGGVIGSNDAYLAVWIQAVMIILCGVLFLFVCKDDCKIDKTSIKITSLIKEANPLSSFIAGRQLLTVTLITLLLMSALQNMSFTAFDQTFNYYLRDRFGFPSSYNGVIKGAMGIITLVANSTLCLWIIRKTKVRVSNIIILLMCTVNMVLAIIFNDLIPFISFNILLFAFNGISMPVLQSIIANNAKKHDSNLVMGIYNAMKSFGGIIGAFSAGLLYNQSPLMPFVFVAIGFAVATAIAVYYNKKKVYE